MSFYYSVFLTKENDSLNTKCLTSCTYTPRFMNTVVNPVLFIKIQQHHCGVANTCEQDQLKAFRSQRAVIAGYLFQSDKLLKEFKEWLDKNSIVTNVDNSSGKDQDSWYIKFTNSSSHYRLVDSLFNGAYMNSRITKTGGGVRTRYENLNVKELQDKCKLRKIKYSGLKKAELIAALRQR